MDLYKPRRPSSGHTNVAAPSCTLSESRNLFITGSHSPSSSARTNSVRFKLCVKCIPTHCFPIVYPASRSRLFDLTIRASSRPRDRNCPRTDITTLTRVRMTLFIPHTQGRLSLGPRRSSPRQTFTSLRILAVETPSNAPPPYVPIRFSEKSSQAAYFVRYARSGCSCGKTARIAFTLGCTIERNALADCGFQV